MDERPGESVEIGAAISPRRLKSPPNKTGIVTE